MREKPIASTVDYQLRGPRETNWNTVSDEKKNENSPPPKSETDVTIREIESIRRTLYNALDKLERLKADLITT